ncbi:hypothetical protein BDV33DRAFT_204302 [Aspergillus novoparasiticus]|uniref:Organic solute transporter Ostalpha-domain-containing protein n=1 Tax=Aspergillus novoparasiticus TaxID=986946 RepID=A0A5N6EPR4_9EURO|nr:hypothetical protein BDV33DRAFT_204302 [Aspergillus novoparasiticus]
MQPIRFLVVHVGRNETGRAANGVKWFDAICFGVFQFCLVKALGAIMKWITEAADVYCLNSSAASHAHIWIMVIEILSLIAAILCLLQFYVATKDQLARHFIFSQLTKEGDVIKPSAKVSYPSWSVSVPNTLLCAEMAAISILHFWAYPYDVYQGQNLQNGGASGHDLNPVDQQASMAVVSGGVRRSSYTPHIGAPVLLNQGGTLGWRAFLDAASFVDIFHNVHIALSRKFMQRPRTRSASTT